MVVIIITVIIIVIIVIIINVIIISIICVDALACGCFGVKHAQHARSSTLR